MSQSSSCGISGEESLSLGRNWPPSNSGDMVMRRNAQAAVMNRDSNASNGGNGAAIAVAETGQPDLAVVLGALQTMRDGDFSVRLPGSWTGLAGKVADTFNEIVAANQQMAQELQRVGQVVGKEGRTRA